MITTSIFIFILGTIIGSFLNVVILRLGTGRLFKGISFKDKTKQDRSICFSCGKTLKWYELIPVLSFFFQKGRCAKCYSKISWQYPIVELVTGAMFVIVFKYFFEILGFNNYEMIINVASYWAIFSILIVIAFYDYRHRIIPNGPVWSFILISLVINIYNLAITSYFFGGINYLGVIDVLLGVAVTAGPLFLIWLFSKGRLMGFGDVKIALGMGILLGFSYGLSALVLSFWIGASVGLIAIIVSSLKTKILKTYQVKTQSVTIKSEIPFGPFLIIATFLVFMFNIDLITLFSWMKF